jgi:hypothetical protein
LPSTPSGVDHRATPGIGPPLQQLAAAFASLKETVAEQAPPEVRDEAIRQAEVLEEAATGPQPDVGVMAKVRSWFIQHAPTALGAVTAVIINPIVGKIVQSAGDAIAAEYRRWFPEAEQPK